jgi:hypothetical protein
MVIPFRHEQEAVLREQDPEIVLAPEVGHRLRGGAVGARGPQGLPARVRGQLATAHDERGLRARIDGDVAEARGAVPARWIQVGVLPRLVGVHGPAAAGEAQATERGQRCCGADFRNHSRMH